MAAGGRRRDRIRVNKKGKRKNRLRKKMCLGMEEKGN